MVGRAGGRVMRPVVKERQRPVAALPGGWCDGSVSRGTWARGMPGTADAAAGGVVALRRAEKAARICGAIGGNRR